MLMETTDFPAAETPADDVESRYRLNGHPVVDFAPKPRQKHTGAKDSGNARSGPSDRHRCDEPSSPSLPTTTAAVLASKDLAMASDHRYQKGDEPNQTVNEATERML